MNSTTDRRIPVLGNRSLGARGGALGAAQAAGVAVDCWFVGSPCFDDVLVDALRAVAGTAAAPARAAASASAAFAASPPHPFLFGSVPTLAQAHAVFAFDAAAKALPPRPRPVRALTTAQQRALESLNALGALLTSGFTAHELRQAYRSIAYRVHPDRQHDCGEAERARRSRLFMAATAHYRHLLALVAAR